MKHFVSITQKKLNGIKSSLLILICVFIISSCSTSSEYIKYNYFNGVNYYNDTLNISATFFGDMKYNKISKKNIKKRILKKIGYNKLLISGKAISVAEEYEVLLFYKIEENESNIDFSNGVLVLNDTINKHVLYKKTEKEKTIFLYLKSLTKSNQTILKDGKTIINSIKFNSSSENELNYSKIFNNYKNEDNFLYVKNKFNNAPIKKSRKNDWMKFQYLTTILSKDPTYYKYVNLIQKLEFNKKKYLDKKIDSLSISNKIITTENDFLNELKSISKDKKVVMLNEMHWHPKHRILALKLLEKLKENGFNYLAVEALDEKKDSLLNLNKFPIKSSGYYTREPYFAIFLREAIKLNYKIVGYDSFDTENREKTQAENIKSIIDKDPNAKVFVYTGIDHILEKDLKKKRMAEYFQNLTGINPLTIDQVELVSNSLNEITFINSSLLKDIKKVNSNVDFFIVNNISPQLEKVYNKENLKQFNLKDIKLEKYKNQEILVSFYFKEEYLKYRSSSIPMLYKIVKFNNNKFELPIGLYQLVIKDNNNNLIISKQINIE
jgi:hypothetical protein